MNIAESTLANAIRYCMRKYCQANIIIAGPIGAGKLDLCGEMQAWFESVESSSVTVFSQYDYYKELDDIPFEKYGKKIDSVEAFEKEEFIGDAFQLIENGYTYIPHYDFSKWSRKNSKIIQKDKLNHKVILLRKGNINLLVGPHAISLLKDVFTDAISVYVNTPYAECINNRFYNPKSSELVGDLQNKYFDEFLLPQIEKEIHPQLDMADIVIR